MKNLIGFVLILFSVAAFSQDQSIGLRLGDPMGITYKKYIPRNKAVEFGLGTVYSAWHQQYYRNAFHNLKKYNGDSYLSHSVQSTVYFQGRYLLQYDIPIEGMMGKLQWYWGLGAMLKLASVDYHYMRNGIVSNDKHTDINFGPEGILGMEYTFEGVPITIFGEFSLLVEIADRPGVLRGFSGVGARYNF